MTSNDAGKKHKRNAKRYAKNLNLAEVDTNGDDHSIEQGNMGD